RVARRQRRRVTERTPDAHEQTAAVTDRGRATGCGQRRSGGRQESLEEGELLDPIQSGRGARDLGVGDVVRDSRELARRLFLALLLKQLVADPNLDVVRLAGGEKQGFVLRLPAEARDRAVVAVVVRTACDGLAL